MSAATVQPPAAPSRANIGLGRLTRVELRKSVDTRAGRWLLGIIAGLSLVLTIGLVLVGEFVDDAEGGVLGLLAVQQLPVGFLLPVVGILAVTSEWSQRTAMTTYALVPDRSRVTLAKIGAAALLALLVGLITLAVSVIGGGVIGLLGGDAQWSAVDGQVWPQMLLFTVINVLVGVAFGLAFANTAVAIVLYFVIPLAFGLIGGLLGFLVPSVQTVLSWIDLNQTSTPLFFEAADGKQWAQLGVSLLLWLVLPMVIGWIRTSKREIA